MSIKILQYIFLISLTIVLIALYKWLKRKQSEYFISLEKTKDEKGKETIRQIVKEILNK